MELPKKLPATFGPYNLQAILGSGGYGKVYKAIDALNRTIALKVIKPEHSDSETLERLWCREIRHTANLQNSQIVKIYNVDKIVYEGSPFLCIQMEYISSTILTEIIHTHGPFPYPVALKFIASLAKLVSEALHKRGIIHRDLKPDNIAARYKNNEIQLVKLLDFGCCKAEDDLSLTKEEFLGTPYYMAVDMEDGPWQDIYSLGAILYYLIAGSPPYEEMLNKMRNKANRLEIMLLQTKAKGVLPEKPSVYSSDIPWYVDELCFQLMHRNHLKRIPLNKLPAIIDRMLQSPSYSKAKWKYFINSKLNLRLCLFSTLGGLKEIKGKRDNPVGNCIFCEEKISSEELRTYHSYLSENHLFHLHCLSWEYIKKGKIGPLELTKLFPSDTPLFYLLDWNLEVAGWIGKTYEAMQLTTARMVYLRFISFRNPKMLDRLKRAILIIENDEELHKLVQFYDLGLVSSRKREFWYTINYSKGITLRPLMIEHQCSEQETVCLLFAISQALIPLHSRGIMHRNVCPEAFLLTEDELRLVDFTLIKKMENHYEKDDLDEELEGDMKDDKKFAQREVVTLDNTALAMDISYVSPEQLRDAKNVDCRTDIWSLGTIAYELIMGKKLFSMEDCNSSQEAVRKIKKKIKGFADLPESSSEFMRYNIAEFREKAPRLAKMIMQKVLVGYRSRPENAAEMVRELKFAFPEITERTQKNTLMALQGTETICTPKT